MDVAEGRPTTAGVKLVISSEEHGVANHTSEYTIGFLVEILATERPGTKSVTRAVLYYLLPYLLHLKACGIDTR